MRRLRSCNSTACGSTFLSLRGEKRNHLSFTHISTMCLGRSITNLKKSAKRRAMMPLPPSILNYPCQIGAHGHFLGGVARLLPKSTVSHVTLLDVFYRLLRLLLVLSLNR